jgi:hypothetical protein
MAGISTLLQRRNPLMLQITQEQFNTLQASVLERANLRLAHYIRERFPTLAQGRRDEDLARFVADVRRRANQYQITEEADIATAVDLTVMYGPNFYNTDWSSDVFAIAGWNGAHKLEVIRERVRRQVPGF